MFKRVEKRRVKKQKEEELGLDEDMKEILGIQDTDSEESASESESDGSSENDDAASGDEVGEDEDIDVGDEEDVPEEEEDDEEEEEEDEDPNVSVNQALIDPVYVVSVLPEVKACIVCPGKLLKGAKMVQLHRTSNAHLRRYNQLKTLSEGADPNESAWEVLRRHSEEKPKLSLAPVTTTAGASASSKRAEKKKAQQAKRKLKREKFKARQAKKREAASTTKESSTDAPKESSVSKKAGKKTETARDTELKPSASLKKKRRLSSTAEPTEQSKPSPSKQTTSSLNAVESSPPKKKSKKQKVESNAQSTSSPALDSATLAKEQESVKNIVRSTSDRAKNARSRALSALKGSTISIPKKLNRNLIEGS